MHVMGQLLEADPFEFAVVGSQGYLLVLEDNPLWLQESLVPLLNGQFPLCPTQLSQDTRQSGQLIGARLVKCCVVLNF